MNHNEKNNACWYAAAACPVVFWIDDGKKKRATEYREM